ncbi:ATP-binding cassette domain-containing protein [Schumannella soli]|uniref:ATP-binding cassette domain-containing protein n=1 Tax=Schumannella soli TaxID=2590779 RepID=UPI001C6403A2|nr:ATP-binding cassette domain-containing protein [Schumannella soli]
MDPGARIVTALEAQVGARRGDFDIDVRVTVEPGQTLAVVGPNGAGKSTLLQALAGIVPLSDGRIRLGARSLADASTGMELPTADRRIGYVFQDYLLFPHLTLLDNVAFGPRARGATRGDARGIARDWLDRVGLADAQGRRPHEISGGQAQRVALARALASDPELLLLDEPLAALDAETRVAMRDELTDHLARFAGPTIVITHSRADVTQLASRLMVIEAGRVVQSAPVADALGTPASGFAERFAAGDFG